MARSHTLALLVGLLLVCEVAAVYGTRQPDDRQNAASVDRKHKKKKKHHPYTSPSGLFIQVSGLNSPWHATMVMNQMIFWTGTIITNCM